MLGSKPPDNMGTDEVFHNLSMARYSEQQTDLREASLSLLEFVLVREKLATHTSFALANEQALALTPSYDLTEVTHRQQETSEAFRFIEAGSELNLSRAFDLRQPLQRASLGGTLSGEELRQVYSTLMTARQSRSVLVRHKELPTLAAIAKDLPNLREVETELASAIGENGEVLDKATPNLKELRSEAQEAHQKLTESLQRTIRRMQRSKHAGVLQEPIITQRNGRLVLLVKAEMRHNMPGIVHDVSDSGATLFVEPLPLMSLGNRWRELRLAEEREEERVLRHLSSLVEGHSHNLLRIMELLTRLDLALAKGRYSLVGDGVCPTIVEGQRPYIRFIEARHPLLQGQVIPNTIELSEGYSTLLITGPNAGGKTVSLKTVGLLALMAQSGLHLPAQEAALTLFDGVYADIGDQQSIERSLSTFSSHIHNLRNIMAQATQRSLVLIDELGASTDPEEGTALAKALLLHFSQRNIAMIATTHHREVAAYVQEQPNMVNASVELDPQSLTPSYRLTMGVPGRSYALTIASRIGMDEETVERAHSFLPQAHRGSEALLKELQLERHLAQERHEQARAALTEAEETRQKLEKELAAIEDTKAQAIEETRQELQRRVNELNKRLKAAETALVHPEQAPVVKEGKTQLAEVRRELRSQEWRPTRPGDRQWIKALQRGDQAYVTGLLHPVEILAPPADENVEVLMGTMRARLPIRQLERPASVASERSTTTFSISQPVKQVGSKLELQGMRVEEALERLEGYLNDAMLSGLSTVHIVHGVGTGALRSAIRERLKGHPLVVSASPAEDTRSDSVTIVSLT